MDDTNKPAAGEPGEEDFEASLPKGRKARIEAMQERVLEVELQTKMRLLRKAERDEQAFEETERRRHEANKTRQDELRVAKRNHEAVVKMCRHKSGGNPQNVLRGGGIGSFSTITSFLMPDGVTRLLQCTRCRMKIYSPHTNLKKTDPQRYESELAEFTRLLNISVDEGLQHNEMRGPTFLFTNAEGTPFVPERK
jgi:hypothetical protein